MVDGYDVVVCIDCGFCFARTLPLQSVLDGYYAAATKYDDAAEPSETDRARFESIASDIAGVVTDRATRVLELGCATGGLLSALSAHGFARLYGLEPSPSCVRAARERHGFDVREGTVHTVKSDPRGPFDCVVLIDVLEHVVDLPLALEQLRRSVVDGATVCVEVPDLGRPWLPPEAPFQHFSVEHVNYFSGESLVNLMAAHGFECASMQHPTRQHKLGSAAEILGFFTAGTKKTTPRHECHTETVLMEYIAQSAKHEAVLREKLRLIARRGQPVTVWATGTLTLRLLEVGAFDDVTIERFIDSNRAYTGRSLCGVPIVSPESLAGVDVPVVVVCSYSGAGAIADAVRSRLGGDTEVVILRNEYEFTG